MTDTPIWAALEQAKSPSASRFEVVLAAEVAELEDRLDNWYKLEARLHAAFHKRFGAQAVAEVISSVCDNPKQHNPLLD